MQSKKDILLKIAVKEKEDIYKAFLESGKLLEDVIELLKNSEPSTVA